MPPMTPTEQAVIFINYRRTDAGWPADRVASQLERTFGEGRVFLDVRGIDAGDEFAAVLEETLRRATTLVVLIGKGWLHAHDKHGRRRLDQEDDWVRREIRYGLAQCRVIPVLIDDAELPEEKEALPPDIANLLGRQRLRVRQAQSDEDIEALSRVLENAGFRRLTAPTASFSGDEFSDQTVRDVAARLRGLQRRRGAEFVGWPELLQELDHLFNRKTFRFESLRSCADQRWADRLDPAYQTEKVLRDWERNVMAVAKDKYPIYVDLLKEVGSYCMQMGVLLFEPAVDYNNVEGHIGKTTFKAQLPSPIQFPVGSDKQPRIPDEVNNIIERHRTRAVALLNELRKERPTDQQGGEKQRGQESH